MSLSLYLEPGLTHINLIMKSLIGKIKVKCYIKYLRLSGKKTIKDECTFTVKQTGAELYQDQVAEDSYLGKS